MRTLILSTLLLAAHLLPQASAQDRQPVVPVQSLDLTRYAGHWHEIARLPVSYQRRCAADSTAQYSLRSDGSIAVRNACRTADGELAAVDGVARVVGDEPARLQVRFAPDWLGWLPMVWADYWVLALDADYQWAMVGEPDRKYLWILAREPSMDAAVFAELRGRAEQMGYDLSALVVGAPLREPPEPAGTQPENRDGEPGTP